MAPSRALAGTSESSGSLDGMNTVQATQHSRSALLKALVFLMFAMFAMTTDSVGSVIPEVIREFDLSLTAAGSFQYATMSGIGIAAIGLGFLADRYGHKATILVGLLLFGISSGLFLAGHSFGLFVGLLFLSGLGIGIFKSAALALIGDLSRSTRDHAATMNLVEGFFGAGAIVGPALVAYLLQQGSSWKWVYVAGAILCGLLILASALAKFPVSSHARPQEASPADSLRMLRDPFAGFFGIGLMLYVGAEAAVYVWAPTYLSGYSGSHVWLAAYVVSIFFVLRAVGRFMGAWLLGRFHWAAVLAFCSTAMALLFWVAVVGGREAAVFALPATGLFMSVLYPTINSTGISCFEKAQHGSIAGLLLFFTCVSAVVAPLLMAAVSDLLKDSTYSMVVGAILATALAILCMVNRFADPVGPRLAERNRADYEPA